ncbi:MAG: YchJ family protein [Rhabdochlamydiaceae bacterium]
MKSKQNKQCPCPCQSKKMYEFCCQSFHEGKKADTALTLMRSRFSAYALCLPDYIILTTHPNNLEFDKNIKEWTKKISYFSLNTLFRGLKILEVKTNERFATVLFFAHLMQGEKDISFTEKSYFEKIDGRWLYIRGELFRENFTDDQNNNIVY